MIDVFHMFAFLQDAAAMVALESARQGQMLTMAVKWGVPPASQVKAAVKAATLPPRQPD